MHHPTDRITHTKAFVTPVVEHWLEQDTVREASSPLNRIMKYEVFCVTYNLLIIYQTKINADTNI